LEKNAVRFIISFSYGDEIMKISIIIPTLNASNYIHRLLEMLKNQSIEYGQLLIIDSTSTDNTVEIAKSHGAEITTIPRNEFDHGGTRNLAASNAGGDILVFLTQDAIPVNRHSLENLIKPFEADEKIAAIYGRQLPNEDASPFSAHLRLFNYPDASYIRSLEDRSVHGFKTIFISDSFSAYRKGALEKIGWFKKNLIFGEDTHAVARLLLEGYKVAYAADAEVYHSHNYTAFQEFRRYFDIGVLHRTESRILKEFGKTKGEGKKYIKSEAQYIMNKREYMLIPAFILRNALKLLGYYIGSRYHLFPSGFASKISMNRNWWHKHNPDNSHVKH
jgi:rhamnosyltransferase